MDNLQLDMVRNSAIGVALFGVALAPLCARAAPLAEQQYVGNDFSARSPYLQVLQRQGSTDGVPPFVILREYGSSGPTTSGAVFDSAGTVNGVTFYGGGKYDFTVYALALTARNPTKGEITFTIVGAETFSGDATARGVQNLPANFSVRAGSYLAFAGIGPFYPETPNDMLGSDATYASSSEPDHFPDNFTAIRPTSNATFTVGAHGDKNASYEVVPNIFGNQGRYYGIGVTYKPDGAGQSASHANPTVNSAGALIKESPIQVSPTVDSPGTVTKAQCMELIAEIEMGLKLAQRPRIAEMAEAQIPPIRELFTESHCGRFGLSQP